MPTLVEIAARHPTDKGTTHSYLELYDQLLVGMAAPVLLEIGIDLGASLRMWRERFPDGVVHGVDNDPRGPGGRWGDVAGCRPVLGDVTDREFVAAAWADGTFDLVVDDGSHRARDQILSVFWLWPKLKAGGLYVIEDVRQDSADLLAPLGGVLLDRRALRPGQFDEIVLVLRKPGRIA